MQKFPPQLGHKIFKAIAEAAKQLDVSAYVIGGFVRDIQLERSSKDIDIVCIGDGIQLAKKVSALLGTTSKVSIFKNFGTAQFVYQAWEVEFVGARKESYNRDSRNPVVEEGSLQDDQNRRDFSINAMAYSLNNESFGEMLDPFNGMEDLGKGIIRTPLSPSETFSDDPLRMMRAIRFASQLNFEIEDSTKEALSLEKDRINIISKERISDELNKIILSPKPSVGFKLLFNCGLLEIIFPEMANLYGVETKNGLSHKDNFYHTLTVLDNISEKTDDLWLRWAAILHDIAKPATKRFEPKHGWTFHGHEDRGARMVTGIFKRLKLPLDHQMKYVEKLVRLHLRPIALVKETVTDSAIRRLLFEAGEDIDDLMKLCHADITTKNSKRQRRYQQNFLLVEEKLKEVEAKDQLRNWQPPIGGEEIMEMFDLKPSKLVGMLKTSIREAILEGEIQNNPEEVKDYLIQIAKSHGLEAKPIHL